MRAGCHELGLVEPMILKKPAEYYLDFRSERRQNSLVIEATTILVSSRDASLSVMGDSRENYRQAFNVSAHSQ